MSTQDRTGRLPHITVSHAGITRVFNVEALGEGDWFATEQAATDALEYASSIAGGQLALFGVTREMAWELVEAGTQWLDTDWFVNRASMDLARPGNVEVRCHGVEAKEPLWGAANWTGS